ncbi:hypothetical protein [Methanolobus sp. ZRKC5]|uniref:hypothetical protein n=1 Tax=Methanolobus sp. ZRKC5 TaxID=3136295 RepID=UPI00313AA0B5
MKSYKIPTFPNTVKNQLTDPILNPLIQYNVEKDQPILSSLVVNKKQSLPGKGFFDTMESMFDIDLSNVIDRRTIHTEELKLIWDFDWKSDEWDEDKWDEIVCRKSENELQNSQLNFEELQHYLVDIAKKQQTATYKQVLNYLGLQLNPGSVGLLVREGLNPMIIQNMEKNEPLLSSLVVRKESKIPGPGFFRQIQLFDKYDGSLQGDDASLFHKKELEKIWNYY